MLWSLLFFAAWAGAATAQSDIPISQGLRDILAKAGTGPYTYPTSLTQGIIPKALHSHNDYWRPVPFYSALSVGAVSVEADVWLVNGTLLVGHEQSALTPARNFDSLYIQPILSVVRAQNPNSSYVAGPTNNGVFDTSSGQTLYLWVDVKTEGARTFRHVIRALQPLRDAGYLTVFDGSSVVPGPVTVIGTGGTPLNLVQGVSPRDYFWDGPLVTLGTSFSNITKEVSPIASTDFAVVFGEVRNQTFNTSQLETLRSQVATAHGKGIGVRYWDQPGWPVGTRNAVWRTLWDNGVDLLNVDDLDGAANFWESSG